MTTVTRRKALTVDALRERLKKAMARSHERDCTTCKGTGRVSGPMVERDVIEGAGISASAYQGFFRQGKSMSLESGLKLLAWLEQLEDPLSVLDDDEDDRESEHRQSARLRQIREASSKAAASGAIDAMNRPVQLNGGGVAAKPDRQLTLGQVHEVRKAVAGGAKVADLASAYRVSVRTIYRACEGEIEEAEVGGHKLVMQVVDGHEPRILARPIESQA